MKSQQQPTGAAKEMKRKANVNATACKKAFKQFSIENTYQKL